MTDFVSTENEYIFYLNIATLASRTGGVPNPSIVTHSRVASAAASDIPKFRKVATIFYTVPTEGGISPVEKEVRRCGCSKMLY